MISPLRLELIIAAAQRSGLTVTSITQHADGSTTISFGQGQVAEKKRRHMGWGL